MNIANRFVPALINGDDKHLTATERQQIAALPKANYLVTGTDYAICTITKQREYCARVEHYAI
jgi:hypothetical protein